MKQRFWVVKTNETPNPIYLTQFGFQYLKTELEAEILESAGLIDSDLDLPDYLYHRNWEIVQVELTEVVD